MCMQTGPMAHVSSVLHIAAAQRQLSDGRVAPKWAGPTLCALLACLQCPAASEAESPMEQATFALLSNAFLDYAPDARQQAAAGAVLPDARLKLLHSVLGTFIRRWLDRWGCAACVE